MNFRHIAVAAAMALGSVTAQASVWTLTAQDFDHVYDNYDTGVHIDYGPTTTVGSFDGEDSNGDGMIDLSEIREIFLNGAVWVNGYSGGQLVHQDIFSFSYKPGALSFYASSGHDFAQFDTSASSSFGTGAPFFSDVYQSTASSQVLVSPVAVPEPASASLLALGLAALVARRRPRATASRP